MTNSTTIATLITVSSIKFQIEMHFNGQIKLFDGFSD